MNAAHAVTAAQELQCSTQPAHLTYSLLLLGLHGFHRGHCRPLCLRFVLRLHRRSHNLGADLGKPDVTKTGEKRGQKTMMRTKPLPESLPPRPREDGSHQRSPAAVGRVPEPGLPPVRHHCCRLRLTHTATHPLCSRARSAPAGRGKAAALLSSQSTTRSCCSANGNPSYLRESDQQHLFGRFSSQKLSPPAATNQKAEQ